MYKVKVVFEFGEGYTSKVLVEEFDFEKLLEITKHIGLTQFTNPSWTSKRIRFNYW